MDLKRIIANNIFMLRNKYNLTQEEFAQKLNVTRGHISHLENGDHFPSAEFIKDVCLSFHVSADWIINSNINLKEDFIFNDKDLLAIVGFHSLNDRMQDIVINLINELAELNTQK